jgi:hypothetical protein
MLPSALEKPVLTLDDLSLAYPMSPYSIGIYTAGVPIPVDPQSHVPPSREQHQRLSLIEYPRPWSSSHQAPENTAEHLPSLTHNAPIPISDTMSTKHTSLVALLHQHSITGPDGHVTPESEELLRKVLPQPDDWAYEKLHRFDLKHVDVRLYTGLIHPDLASKCGIHVSLDTSSIWNLPPLVDGNFFTQKVNEYLTLDLEPDDAYGDMYSQMYIRCLMFTRLFHPTIPESAQGLLADLYYLTTETSKIEAD